MKMNTPQFRVAFPNVFKPRLNSLNKKEEYSLVALFPVGTDLSELKAACKEVAEKKWPEGIPTGLRSPFRDQGERKKKNDAGQLVLPPGYEEGGIFLNLKTVTKPGLVDNQVQDIIDSSEFYGGCWARASVSVYAYDQGGNRGVNFGLGNIQKIKDDTPFGNRTKPQDDFAPVGGAIAAQTSGAETSASSMFS